MPENVPSLSYSPVIRGRRGRRLWLSKIPNLLFVLIQLAERKEVPLGRERKGPKPDHDKSKEYRDAYQNDYQISRVLWS